MLGFRAFKKSGKNGVNQNLHKNLINGYMANCMKPNTQISVLVHLSADKPTQ